MGKYRKINVDVGDSINFSLSFELIEESMLNFLNDINYKRKMSIDDICEFHCRFEKIHPFLDGNGRIGRLIILRQCILNNIGLFIISSETRQEYINSLRLYHQTGFSSFLITYCKKLQIFFKEKYESKYQSDFIDREE
jgi:Fic family protein